MLLLTPSHADGTEDTHAGAGGQRWDADEMAWVPDDAAEKSPTEPARGKRMSLQEIKQRDALLTACVKRLRMTVPQITAFSRSWEHPFYGENDVWRRLEALRLDRKVRRVARQSIHDQWAINIFIKIARDAVKGGHPVFEIAKEHRIGEDSGIRADFRFRIRDRLFYLETQHSALTYVSWKAKLGKYVRYRKRKGVKPFRVLIVMEDEHNLNTVLRYTREVLSPHPGLSLFLLAWMPDLMGQYDTVTEDVWTDHAHRPVALLG